MSQAGYSKSTTESVCLSRQQACWAENAREGYGIDGEKPGGKKEANNNDPKGKKPKKEKEWKRPLPHIAGPSKSGLIGNIGNNAQLGKAQHSDHHGTHCDQRQHSSGQDQPSEAGDGFYRGHRERAPHWRRALLTKADRTTEKTASGRSFLFSKCLA